MKTLIALLALFSTTALAQGNVQAGKTLHAKECNACHAARFGGNGDGNGGKIYTRADRRVKSTSSLAQMVTTCNTQLDLNLFPEDEQNLAAYLNTTYYKFK